MKDEQREPSGAELLTRADNNSLWLLEAYRRGYRGGYWYQDKAKAMSLSLLKFVGQASLVDDAMLPS